MMRLRPINRLKQTVAIGFLGLWSLGAAISQQAPGKVDFRRDVLPLLQQYCIECHGPSQQMHGFRLDRRRDAMRGGTIAMITPGSSEGSRFYHKLIGTRYGPQMPMTGPLSPDQIAIFKAWIDQGAEWPDDLAGETPPAPSDPKAGSILKVIRDGNQQAFRRWLRAEAKIGNRKGPGGTTPLMQAVLYGDAESVRLLLAKGADPNLRNEAGATALMWAVNDLEKTRLLLAHGADVNAHSNDGRTPLLIAAGQFDSTAVVKLLLDRGANVAAKSPSLIGYATALSEASRRGNEALLRLLIERGGEVKTAGLSPFANSFRTGCGACLDTLMKHGDREALSRVAIQLVPPGGDARAIKAVLDLGIDASATDTNGRTVLMLAASSDAIPVETVQALIERGADVNAKSPDGKTALDFAKQRGDTAVVDLLIRSGAREETVSSAPLLRPKSAGSVRGALQRSLPLLQRVDSMFTRKAGCVSCHHNTLTAMTVATARNNGFPVDEKIARTQVKWISDYIETWRERALQGVGIPGDFSTISYLLLGLAAENYPPDAATDAMARLLMMRQGPDGQWRMFTHRPPIESSDIQATAASLRSLQVYGPKAQRATYRAAVKRAADWLLQARPQTTQDSSFQLLGLHWAGVRASQAVMRKTAGDLLAKQRPDGGWAQLPSLPSDAYATGQALVALKLAADPAVTEAAFQRGIEFLLKTQLEDGSWYVRSRAIPLQPYFESGFPHGHDQWVSAAGTNWAAMALAESIGPKTR